MVFIKILLQQYKEQHLDFGNKVLYLVVLMDYTQEVKLLVLLVVFKYLELLVMEFLHMVFIKSLELYMVQLMEYILMVIFKVTTQIEVVVL